jgi:hypothetical protein
MIDAHRQHHMQAMRDLYSGTTPPTVADPIQPAKVISYERAGGAIVATINDRGTLRRLHLEHADHPELMRLSDFDRGTLQGALMTLAREVGDAT